MNLDRNMKQAIVKAIMAEVPRIDYEGQIRDMLLTNRLPKLTPELRAIWNDPPLRGYLKEGWCEVTHTLQPFWDVPVSQIIQAEIEVLAARSEEQSTARYQMERKLTNMFSKVRTSQQFERQFPEFTAYLPTKEASTTSFPLVANIIAELTQLGWPQGAKA